MTILNKKHYFLSEVGGAKGGDSVTTSRRIGHVPLPAEIVTATTANRAARKSAGIQKETNRSPSRASECRPIVDRKTALADRARAERTTSLRRRKLIVVAIRSNSVASRTVIARTLLPECRTILCRRGMVPPAWLMSRLGCRGVERPEEEEEDPMRDRPS